MQDQQQQALTQAGGKIAGNIPPKTIGKALAQQQGLPIDETEE